MHMCNSIGECDYSDNFLFPLPHMLPKISISPFSPVTMELAQEASTSSRENEFNVKQLLDYAESFFSFKSGREALSQLLRLIGLTAKDNVLILTTTQGPYISSCVTKAITGVCGWSRTLDASTKAILVIHEFGIPCVIPDEYRNMSIPIIEDCAYALGTRAAGGNVGKIGDYAIYSLPKYLPIPIGGLIVVKEGVSSKIDAASESKKIFKQILTGYWGSFPIWNERRLENWRFFSENLRELSDPYFVLKNGEIPGVYLLKLQENEKAHKLKEYMLSVGIESTVYYGNEGFLFPLHQYLTKYECQYIVRHFLRGYFES